MSTNYLQILCEVPLIENDPKYDIPRNSEGLRSIILLNSNGVCCCLSSVCDQRDPWLLWRNIRFWFASNGTRSCPSPNKKKKITSVRPNFRMFSQYNPELCEVLAFAIKITWIIVLFYWLYLSFL